MHRGLSWLTSGRRERGIKGLGRVSINANSVLLGHRARPPRMPTHTLTHSRANRTDRSPEFWGSPTLRGERGSCALSLSLSPKPPCAEDSPGEPENADASALFQWVVFGPSNLHSGARGPGRGTGPAALQHRAARLCSPWAARAGQQRASLGKAVSPNPWQHSPPSRRAHATKCRVSPLLALCSPRCLRLKVPPECP